MVFFNDLVADGQSQSRTDANTFGRKAGIEYPVDVFGFYAGTVIRHFYVYVFIIRRGGNW